MKKKIKVSLIFSALIVVLAFGAYYVVAQTVIDSYDNDNNIASTWNISTSTVGQITIAERECDPLNWYCSASTTCANYAGDGDYIIVAKEDAPSTKQWKTSATNCNQPECGIDGGQNGDNLKVDNIIDFSDYPARNYCKFIGARLPTRDELSCMYTNRATFGSNFAADDYWSGIEYNYNNAWAHRFSDDWEHEHRKDNSEYVRCVIGW